MDVLGHRGSRRPGPENTLSALRRALSDGAAGAEVDVRRCRDALVCVHNPTLGGRRVDEATLAELRRRGVPTVQEMLAATVDARTQLVLEVKSDPREPGFDPQRGAVRELVELVADTDLGDARIVVSSFDAGCLTVAHEAGLRTGLLIRPLVPLSRGSRQARAGGFDELHAHVSAFAVARARAEVARVRDAGLRLVSWTVTRPRQALRQRELGVDAVICDDPAEILTALQ